MRRVPMYMKDWIEKLHGFLKLNERDILKDAGMVSHELAKEIAEKHFHEYKKLEATHDLNFDEIALRAIENTKGRKLKKLLTSSGKKSDQSGDVTEMVKKKK